MRGLVLLLIFAICAAAAAGVFIARNRDLFSAPAQPPGQQAAAKAPVPATAVPAPAAEPVPAPESPSAGPDPSPEQPAAPFSLRAVLSGEAPREPAAEKATGRPKQPSAAPAATAPDAAPPAAKPQATAQGRISPPPAAAGVRWGMSRQALEARFPIAWHKTQRAEVTLVHYPPAMPDETQIRFIVSNSGLSGLEVHMKPPDGQTLARFHQQVRRQYGALYGSLPGSTASSWTDGETRLNVRLDPLYVVAAFRPAR